MTNIELIAKAKDVLAIEASAILDLKNSIDMEFVNVIEAIFNMKGRLIVTGIGKSGHIAKKISATFASTGTPSFFIHPTEASHGDLGMITKDDYVLMLSNSGKTEELYNTISYCKRFDVPIIAITGNDSSTLAQAASFLLLLPKFTEACPLGLAPTTSTTMQLALGDAIAITLLQKRGFSSEDFGVFHPGGSLGSKLLRVVDIMHKNPPLVTKDMDMKEAIVAMTSGAFGIVGIIDSNNKLIGVFTDGDLRRYINDNDLLCNKIEKYMTIKPIVVHEQIMVTEALKIMNDKKITSLLVVDKDNNCKGVLHIHDCLRAGVK